MASHHTKDKGDLGLGMVISDLMCHGIGVFIPLSEHQPYDLIAVREDGAFSRVQVKYRKLRPNGSLTVEFISTHADIHGYHKTQVDRNQFDCYAIYCPDNRRVYYIRNDDVPCSSAKSVALRVFPPRNNQRRKVLMASQFESRERIFPNTPP
ncbi:MAG: group I intron-associated PD-(D/E)XK endonuclease [Candidatus Geothermincolia bacterium]